MAEHWQPLIANLAVVALFILTWVHGQFVLARLSRRQRNAAFGLTMGLGAIASMLLAIPLEGSLFDLRSSLIAVAGFAGGPIAGSVAAAIAIAYRVGLVGGPNAILAMSGIVLAALLGVAVSVATRRHVPAIWAILVLAIAVAGVTIGLAMLLRASGTDDLTSITLQVAAMNAVATALSAFLIMRRRVADRERSLLGAAFIESPDLQYVTTPDGRYAAVNANLATLNGFPSPAAMIGKTDPEITTRERAEASRQAEQRILETGEPLIDSEECLLEGGGDDIWYLTSKVPLHDLDGEIIGIAGVTRDITSDKRLRQELTDSRNQLNYVLSEISDGIAMYDRQGTLAYCNDQFSKIFPLTSAVRRRGQHIRDILQAVVETREQKGIPDGNEDRWVDEVAGTLAAQSGREIELYDGRWLHVRTRPTADGSSLVVVSDVTSIKQAQAAMLAMTEQLKLLATTDGLTGLMNRRAFDESLGAELLRSRRSGAPLSLMMVDVDRFKSYNDLYGHVAGDEVLKSVAVCLKAALRRPGDVAARYGGEEFVAILPETDEDGAFFMADAFCESLRTLNIPHKGGDKGVVTASVGIATLAAGDAIEPAELVGRADEALYNAKGAGRDRVTGWRAKHAITQVAT